MPSYKTHNVAKSASFHLPPLFFLTRFIHPIYLVLAETKASKLSLRFPNTTTKSCIVSYRIVCRIIFHRIVSYRTVSHFIVSYVRTARNTRTNRFESFSSRRGPLRGRRSSSGGSGLLGLSLFLLLLVSPLLSPHPRLFHFRHTGEFILARCVVLLSLSTVFTGLLSQMKQKDKRGR